MPPTLHLFYGKPAAGKSTLAATLGAAPGTVTLAEDAWLAALYGDEMRDLADYQRNATRLRTTLTPHVVELLKAGLSVVLDFPANTPETRAWMRDLAEAAHATPRLHWLDLPDATCKARLQTRNAAGTHPFSLTEAQFDRIARHISPPTPAEGFLIERHTPDRT